MEQGADTAHRDVRAASQLVEALARRVGCIPDGAPLPRAIQQQRWSPFNVPLMWSAAGTSATTPLWNGWMVGASRGLTIPAVEFHEGSMEPDAAVVVGWTALREVFRGWSIMAAEDLTTRLCQEGFPRCAVGNHISARAQEHILRQACEVDARVAWLEVMYVLITVHLGRQLAVPDVQSVTVPMPPPPVRSVEITGATWEFLDQVDLGDIFLQRIPVLKQCPRFFASFPVSRP